MVVVENRLRMTVEVLAPGQKGLKLTVKDTLDGGAILPGFTEFGL